VLGRDLLCSGRGVVHELCRRTLLGKFGVYFLLSVRGRYRLGRWVEWLYRLRCRHVPSGNWRVELHELRGGDAVSVRGYYLLGLCCWPVPTKHRCAQLHIMRRRFSLCCALCNYVSELRELRCRNVRWGWIERVLKLCFWAVRGQCRLERVHELFSGYLPNRDRSVGVLELRCGVVLERRGSDRSVDLL